MREKNRNGLNKFKCVKYFASLSKALSIASYNLKKINKHHNSKMKDFSFCGAPGFGNVLRRVSVLGTRAISEIISIAGILVIPILGIPEIFISLSCEFFFVCNC